MFGATTCHVIHRVTQGANVYHSVFTTFIFSNYYVIWINMIQTKRALVITAIAVVAVMAGTISAISFSTTVHGQATVNNCTANGPNKGSLCSNYVNTPSANPAGPNTNTQNPSHNTGQQGSAQLGGGAVVQPKTQLSSLPACQSGLISCGNEVFGGVSTPSGNTNSHSHNATSP